MDPDLADRRVVVPRHELAVLPQQSYVDARERRSHRPRAPLARHPERAVHERLGEPVALDDPLPGGALDAGVLAERERGRARDEHPRAGERGRDLRVALARVREAVVHRRDAEEHGPAADQRGGHGLRREAADVLHRAAEADRAEQPEHEPVDVEERQPVDERVGVRPLPDGRERIEVGRDRAARDDGPLGRAGGP